MALPGPSSKNFVGSTYNSPIPSPDGLGAASTFKSLIGKNAGGIVSNAGAPVVQYQPNGWYWSKIDGARWDKYYPYQVLVVDKQDNSYVQKKGNWVFTLPVPPESMSITMPFAISSAVTLDGVVEEHNGAPIRNIVITGSFGVNPTRASAPTITNNIGFMESIIGGTIQQASRLGAAAENFSSLQSGESKYWKRNVYSESDFVSGTGEMAQFTGYYQWRLFQMFLEAFVELKKTKEGRSARLAFAVWKDEAVYLVTPLAFDVRRSAGSPLEYTYSFAMKATSRVKLGGAPPQVIAFLGINRTPSGFLQRLLTSIDSARRVLLEAGRLPLALSNDLKSLGIEPLRELTFFAKDALGLPLSFADVADSFISDSKWAIIDALNTVNAGKHIKQKIVDRYTQTGRKAKEAWETIKAVASERQDSNGTASESHPASNVFSDPLTIYDLLAAINIGDITLSPKLMSRLQEERDRMRAILASDLKLLADRLALLSDLVEKALGLGGTTVAPDRGSPVITREPTDEDFEALYSLNQVIMDLKSVIAAKTDENNRLMNSLDYMAGLAQRSGIAFNVPTSKFAVPFSYGSTLESLALQYLNDPNRWFEIAALNGLQEPYVDEVGFDQKILVNGAGNTVVVADSSKYYVGQTVWISSSTAARTKRQVVKILHMSPNQHIITVDGASDMDQFTTLAGSTIHSFLPNTVNSQMLIYIPSDTQPGVSDFKTNEIPGVKEFDHMIAVGGVDYLLDSNNDLVISPDGSDRWAVGLTNIVQKVRLMFATPRGSLLDHPSLGNPMKVGMSIADLDPDQAVECVKTMFEDDPSFSSVKGVQLEVKGPVAKVGVALEIAGTSQVVPISVEIKQS